MQKLYMSKDQILTPWEDYTFPLFWPRDSDKMAVNLHHVPWEHSQTFPLKELKDAKNARQVTSNWSCQPCDEMPDSTNRRSCFMPVNVWAALDRKLSLTAYWSSFIIYRT